MSAQASRNRQRKAAYSALADKGSRNQVAIKAPIVGRFETREIMRPCPACDYETHLSCKRCGGTGRVVDKDSHGRARLIEVIVHDEKKAALGIVASTRREPNAQKQRRQLFAWSNCLRQRMTGMHAEGTNCRSCGCPNDKAVIADDFRERAKEIDRLKDRFKTLWAKAEAGIATEIDALTDDVIDLKSKLAGKAAQ